MTAYVTHFIFILDVVVTFCASIRQVPVADITETETCHHGVATYKDVLNGNADTSVIDDGKSGWLSGYADLSTTLAFEGCFDYPIEQVKRQIGIEQNNILNDCTIYCKYPKYHYFAVKNDKCYCLENDERNKLNQYPKGTLNCLNDCNGILDSRCGNLVRAYRYNPITNISGHGQCLYVSTNSRNSQKSINFGSASCRTLERLTQGFICEYRATDKCEDSLPRYPYFCPKSKPMFTWEEGLAKCSNKGGNLISLSHSNSFRYLIECCNKYWVGGFRVIKPVQDKRHSCLAITRINSSYFLDSGDCKTSKVPVCKLSPSTITVPLDQTDIPEQTNGDNNQVLVTIGVTVGIIFIIVILLCIFFRCFKNRETSHLNKTLINHENDFTNQANSDHVISDGTQSLPSNERSNTVRSGKKDTPMKPERNTLRRQKKSIQSYENFQLVPLADSDVEAIKIDTNKEKGEDEYDHVNLQKINMKANNVTDKESEVDVHIYNHMPKHGNEYDVTTVVSSHMSARDDYSVTDTLQNHKFQQLKLQDYTDEDLDQYDSVSTDQTNKMSKLGQNNEREKGQSKSQISNVQSNKRGIIQINPSPNNSRTLDCSNSKCAIDNRMAVDKRRMYVLEGADNIKETADGAFLLLPQPSSLEPSNPRVVGERINTLKVLEDDRGDEGGEDYYHYIDDEKLTLDHGEEQSGCHEYSDMNYGAVGPQLTQPDDYSKDRNRNSDNVYAQVNKASKF